MKRSDADLDRLLRSAATAAEPAEPAVPFGFETRVVALAQAGNGSARDTVELTRFLRRVGTVALVVLALASIGTYRQFTENEERRTPQTNLYAIADSAIQTEFSQ